MESTTTHFVKQLSIAVAILVSSSSCFAQGGSETVATAAKKAFDKGNQELAAGNHTGAITLLKTAVRIQPENAMYHHKLAKAFLAAQKFHEMWVHLRKATVLELGNKEYSQDFLRMWQYHDLEGTLNVGVTTESVLKAMGEPDKRVENDRMKRWVYGFMAVDFGTNKNGEKAVFRVIDLRGYSGEAAQEVEQVSVKTDPNKWKVAHHQVSRTNDNLELTLNDEKIQQWTELFSKQRFPMMSRSNATVAGMVETMRNSLAKVDPNMEFSIISESPNEILYHWITNATEGNPAQHEVAKIMKGQKDFYRVAYVKKTERLSDQELAKWKTVIGNAKLVAMNSTNTNSTTQQSGGNSKNAAGHAWELGTNLALAALVRGKHGPDEVVKSTLLKVSKNAQALGVSVPAPGKLTDDVNADTSAAMQYLLGTAGKPIYNALQQKFGDTHSALFELATKSTLLTMLYQPGDSTGMSIASAIERSAKKANLQESIWKPLTDKVAEKAEPGVVRIEIKQFQQRVADTLAK